MNQFMKMKKAQRQIDMRKEVINKSRSTSRLIRKPPKIKKTTKLNLKKIKPKPPPKMSEVSKFTNKMIRSI